jgi:hypothetical protein
VKKNKLFMLLGILVLLIAVYAGLSIYNKKTAEREAAEAEAEQISLVEADELTALAYSDGTSEMDLRCEDGTWSYGEDDEIPLDQDLVETIVSAVLDLTAVREIEEPDALADYGLEEPSYTITYTSEGEEDEVTLLVGNATGEDYYMMIQDADSVYTIDSTLVYSLTWDLADLVEYDTMPSVGSGNILKVDVTENGETTSYEDEDDLAELAGGWGTISLTDCADYHVTDDTLEEYGLDEAQRIAATVTYTDSATEEEETCTVYIGKTDEDGTSQYVMPEGSKMVYRVGVEIVQNMISVDADDTDAEDAAAEDAATEDTATEDTATEDTSGE